jgi:hypothetical protein
VRYCCSDETEDDVIGGESIIRGDEKCINKLTRKLRNTETFWTHYHILEDNINTETREVEIVFLK